MINKQDLLKYITSGATLTADLKPITLDTGYIVSRMGFEKTYKPHEIDKIIVNIMTYKHLLKKGDYIGIWYNDGLVYIDISRHYKQKRDAIYNGVKNKQLAIFDLKNKCDINLMAKTYTLYKYNAIKNDITHIKEYYTKGEMLEDLKTTYEIIRHYIQDSIDKPIKYLLNDKYIIISNDVYYDEIADIINEIKES